MTNPLDTILYGAKKILDTGRDAIYDMFAEGNKTTTLTKPTFDLSKVSGDFTIPSLQTGGVTTPSMIKPTMPFGAVSTPIQQEIKTFTPELKAQYKTIYEPSPADIMKSQQKYMEKHGKIYYPESQFKIPGTIDKTITVTPQEKNIANTLMLAPEMIAKGVTTIYGEIMNLNKETLGKGLVIDGKVNLGVDARRLGFTDPKYVTAQKEFEDAVLKGEDPLISGLRIISEKALDASIGGQFLTGIARILSKNLLKGGVEAQYDAWNILGKPTKQEMESAGRRLALQTHPDTKYGSQESFSLVNNAVALLRKQGIPSPLTFAKVQTGRLAEVVGRETPIKKGADILGLNIKPKVSYLPPSHISGLLPGQAIIGKPQPNIGMQIQPVKKITAVSDVPPTIMSNDIEVVKKLQEAKGLSAQDIIKKHPDIELKRDVPVTDIYGRKSIIPAGEALTPYELKGNKVLLQDGQTYIVSRSQAQNITNNAIRGEAKPFAPELKGTEETVKGAKSAEIQKLYASNDEEVQKASQKKYGKSFDELTDRQQNYLIDNSEAFKASIEDNTKFSQYQLPEGKKYKEILIKAPIEGDSGFISWFKKNYGTDQKGEIPKLSGFTKEQRTKIASEYKQTTGKTAPQDLSYNIKSEFKSSHWSEPNVISHLRLNERTYQGKKVTFMEELQSDWAREGRSKGFVTDITKDTAKQQGYSVYKAKSHNGNDAFFTGDPTNATPGMRTPSFGFDTEAEAWNSLLKHIEKKSGSVPFNPLLKNWQELSVKRALKEAVDNNSEYLAWISGEQTSARYNLATYLKNVEWEQPSFFTKDQYKNVSKVINLEPKTGNIIEVYIDKNGKILNEAGQGWEGKKIDEAIGKGLADKIMEKEKGQLSGEGLAFGGEWAKNLYDKQVKNIVEDVTGGKVEVIDMGLPIEKTTKEWRIVENGKPPYTFKTLNKNKIKVGLEVHSSEGAGESYIITDILGDGKFKAVLEKDWKSYNYKKSFKEALGWMRSIGTAKEETFDISIKKSVGQQAIKITPEIRARIKGEAPILKKPSGLDIVAGKVKQYIKNPKPGMAIEDVTGGLRPDSFEKANKKQISPLEYLTAKKTKDIKMKEGTSVYHGGKLDNINDIKYGDEYLGSMRTQDLYGQSADPIRDFGVNFTREKDIAKDFSPTGNILEAYFVPKKIKKYNTDNQLLNELLDEAYKVSDDINWLEAKKIKNINKKNEFLIDNHFDKNIVKKIKDDLLEQGYDSIQFRNTLDGGTTIIPLKRSALTQEIPLVKKTISPLEYLTAKNTSPEIQEQELKIEMKKEAIESSRVKATPNVLKSIMNIKEGGVRELGDVKGKVSQKIEDLMAKSGFTDPVEYKNAVEIYIKQKQDLKLMQEELKNLKKIIPPSISLKIPKINTSLGGGRSIEIQANQALNILKGEPVLDNVSLPKIIEKTITPVNHKVHIIDTYLTTPKYVMEKIGFGKEAEMLRDSADAYWKELPINLDIITKWSKQISSKEANKDIFRFLDGEAITLKKQDLKIAREIKEWLKEWAERLNLPKDNTISHYITHIFDREFITKEFDEDLAKIITDKIAGQVYDPFLLKRLGAKGYKQDTWQALDAYVKRATRKVYMDPVLEQIKKRTGSYLEVSFLEKSQFNYIKRYIDNINMRPSELEEGIDNFLKNHIGYVLGQRPTTAILKFFRQATSRGMLGLNMSSALRNLSQGINTYAVLGEKYTTLGYVSLFKKESIKELQREGVLNAGFIQDRSINATKKTLENIDKGLYSMFQTAEYINRGSTYFGAKTKALDEGKSFDEAVKFAKEIVRKTQFSFDTVDIPVGMSSDIVKTLFQFQTFTTKQIEFLSHLIKDKNFIGLTRYVLSGLLFVYTIGQVFNMKPEELIPIWRIGLPPSLKFPAEVFKTILNTPNKYNQTRKTKEKLSDIGKSTIGLIPAGIQAKKTLEGITTIQKGGSYTAGGKFQFPQEQTPAKKLQAILFGKYASQEAQDYFEKTNQQKTQNTYNQIQKLKKEGKIEEANNLFNTLIDEDKKIYKDIKIKDLTDKVQPIYNKIQTMKKQGGDVSNIFNKLSDEEKEIYKKIKIKDLKEKMKPIYAKLQQLKREGKIEEADLLYDNLSDADREIYDLLK